jgi:hypothetical protein
VHAIIHTLLYTTVQTNRLKGKVVDEYGNEDGEGQSYNQNNSNNSGGKTGDSFSHSSDKKSNNKHSKDAAVDGKSDEVCILQKLYSCVLLFGLYMMRQYLQGFSCAPEQGFSMHITWLQVSCVYTKHNTSESTVLGRLSQQ